MAEGSNSVRGHTPSRASEASSRVDFERVMASLSQNVRIAIVSICIFIGVIYFAVQSFLPAPGKLVLVKGNEALKNVDAFSALLLSVMTLTCLCLSRCVV